MRYHYTSNTMATIYTIENNKCCQMWSIWKCSKIATTILEDDNCSFLQDSIQAIWSSGSVLVAHKLSSLLACGIFPEQGSNPCPLHWQVDF